ncbi:Threonine aldolase [Quaeritorhiza haematococci]|nr:Threonine aldolase [Quaeritorhiza haematococci]
MAASSASIYSQTQNAPAKQHKYDFRSDTFTVPTREMREAMMNAEVGDDVFEEDPTVKKLQEHVANLTGKEGALYCCSATMTNQLAIRSHLTSPPYSVLCDARAHINNYEAGGVSYHTGATIIPVRPRQGSYHLTVEDVEKNLVVDDDIHHAPTRLIVLENTLNGELFPLEEIKKISTLVKKYDIPMHLDGARIWNASIASKISLKEYCSYFDTVSLCCSKGLGAPVGSVLVGTHKLLKKARHMRKVFGGGWRQAGILAAAALYAIEHHWPRLADDHARAKKLAEGLKSMGFQLTHRVDTNMVWFDAAPLGEDLTMDVFEKELMAHGIRVFSGNTTQGRLVLHHQISDEGVEAMLVAVRTMLQKMGRLK